MQSILRIETLQTLDMTWQQAKPEVPAAVVVGVRVVGAALVVTGMAVVTASRKGGLSNLMPSCIAHSAT